ncbi:MAG: 2-hydroxy-3-oxopropionate reductase [Eubacteriales bacterium]|nr:2-hydroxy-3-oxopropionate reductase [Eubacteriales bacterium]
MKIGFIGLGIMGKPMARNLMKAGYKLIVFDIKRGPVEELAAEGALAAVSAADVAERCSIIITMLPNSPHVKEAVTGKGGILESAAPGTIIVDMSSISPIAAKEVHDACKAAGVKMIDAPVSGGEPKAVDGTLSIMAGGEKEVFDEVRDILLKMGSSAVLCGGIGAGNTTKLANQVIVALNIAAMSEALMLGVKAGVDPEVIYSAIRGGLAGSTVLDAKAPMVVKGNFKPGFRIDLHIKDLQNAIDTGHAVGAPLPLSAYAMEMMQTLKADGYGQEDHSAIARYYEKITGTAISK